MSVARRCLSLLSALALSSCGTYVPDTQDFPGNQGDQQLLVAAVIKSIHCEVGNAISDIYEKAKHYPAMAPVTRALETWGMQLTLSLKTEEKGSLNPVVVWSPPSPATALFSLTGGVSGAADAIRTDKVYIFYRIKDLKHFRCETGRQPLGPVSSPLIQKSLKFRDFLFDMLVPVADSDVAFPTSPTGPLEKNVLSYEVSFEITTSGSLNPSWVFTRVIVNPDTAVSPLATASRDRTHDLQITMGPADDAGLKGPAASAQLSGDVGRSVANSVRSVVGR